MKFVIKSSICVQIWVFCENLGVLAIFSMQGGQDAKGMGILLYRETQSLGEL